MSYLCRCGKWKNLYHDCPLERHNCEYCGTEAPKYGPWNCTCIKDRNELMSRVNTNDDYRDVDDILAALRWQDEDNAKQREQRMREKRAAMVAVSCIAWNRCWRYDVRYTYGAGPNRAAFLGLIEAEKQAAERASRERLRAKLDAARREVRTIEQQLMTIHFDAILQQRLTASELL